MKNPRKDGSPQKKAPKDYEKYEKFISRLVSDIQQAGRDIRNIGFGVYNRVTGISGAEHQVDVSFVDHSVTPVTTVLIECKRWKKSPSLERVKVLKATLDDVLGGATVQQAKGIVITTAPEPKKNRRSNIKTYAKFYDITIEKVPHDYGNYVFNYADLIFVNASDSLESKDGYGEKRKKT